MAIYFVLKIGKMDNGRWSCFFVFMGKPRDPEEICWNLIHIRVCGRIQTTSASSSWHKGKIQYLVSKSCTRHFAYIIILSLQSFYKANDFISLVQMKKLRFRKIKINYINVSHTVTTLLKNNNFIQKNQHLPFMEHSVLGAV